MKTIPQKYILPALALVFVSASSLFAETIFFNDTLQNDAKKTANGTIEIDSSFKYMNPDTSLTNTLKWTPDGEYKNGGLEFYSKKTVPTGSTNLEFTFYVDDINPWVLNGFVTSLDTGNFDMATDIWTINGTAGSEGASLAGQTWHTINVDLTSIANFEAGTSQLNGFVTIKNNTTQPDVYIGDIRLTSIPEPSSVMLLVAAGGFLLYLRRKK